MTFASMVVKATKHEFRASYSKLINFIIPNKKISNIEFRNQEYKKE